MTAVVPVPPPLTGLRALRAILRERSVMGALRVFHAEMGPVFRLNAPGFMPVMLAGADAVHFVTVEHKDDFIWRIESDPLTELLIHGVLVEDGDSHETIRRQLSPSLHRRMMDGYAEAMLRRTDQVINTWANGQRVDMLTESRKIALLILMDALYGVDYTPELTRLWETVLYMIKFISPGLWLLWRGVPRPGYKKHRAKMDDYLMRIIALRRGQLDAEAPEAIDMLGMLIQGGMGDALIRDQLMTMLIAGHDTSTALLAWVFQMFCEHPDAMARAADEVAAVLGDESPNAENTAALPWLQACLDETLRLYPPIHLGSRTAARDLEFKGHHIAAGERVLYSIFLTQRDPTLWDNAEDFQPERFMSGSAPARMSYVPFGWGKRNCIGAAFAQVESRIVVARLLQRIRFSPVSGKPAHIHMGATLEPRPGVAMTIQFRK
jgi:cytochrome P450